LKNKLKNSKMVAIGRAPRQAASWPWPAIA
jgi:hypothetical protein